MHMDDFLVRLQLIRRRLPRAYILVFTNGDYLDMAAYRALMDAGVNELKVAMHLAKDKPYDERDILKRVFDKACELKLTAVLRGFVPDKCIDFTFVGSKAYVHLTQENYMTEGHSRGETLSGVGQQVADRTAVCLQPFDNFILNYKGDVLPCCTTIGATAEIEPCIVGNAHDASIFDIYCGEKLTGWRRHTMTEGAKRHPCATCPEQWSGFPDDWAAIYAQALALADALVTAAPAEPK
jgi:hypothetical protein